MSLCAALQFAVRYPFPTGRHIGLGVSALTVGLLLLLANKQVGRIAVKFQLWNARLLRDSIYPQRWVDDMERLGQGPDALRMARVLWALMAIAITIVGLYWLV
jgi:hypothetical protein